jgi:hypothetical protein
MPVDYSPLMGGTADLGNALVRAEQVKGIRQQNALAQRQMSALDQQDQSRAALNSFVAANPQATVQDMLAAGLDPGSAMQYAGQRNQLAEQESILEARQSALRQEAYARIEPLLGQIENSAAPARMAQYLLPKAQQMGFFPDGMDIGDDDAAVLQGVQQFRALAKAMAPPSAGYALVDNAEGLGFRPNTVVQRGPGGQLQVLQGPPPAAPTVNVGLSMPPEEREEQKAVGKAFGEMYADIQKSGTAAAGKIARYDRLGTLLDGIQTGKLTPAAAEIAAVAESVGIKIDSKLGAKQAADALSKELALQLRNPAGGAGMPGAMSDADRQFLQRMTPDLSTTPEGRRLMLDTSRKLAQRERDVARLARDYRKESGQLDEGFFDELDRWSAENPLFPEAAVLGGNDPLGIRR